MKNKTRLGAERVNGFIIIITVIIIIIIIIIIIMIMIIVIMGTVIKKRNFLNPFGSKHLLLLLPAKRQASFE